MSNINVNGKALNYFLFAYNSNVCPICHPLREVRNQNVHDHNLDLSNGSISNINMPIERPYATFYLLAIAMFALSVTTGEIITFELPNVLYSNL